MRLTRTSYAKLGLLPTLSKQSGGLDRSDPYASVSTSSASGIANNERVVDKPWKGMARVIRDDDGRVVDIVEYEDETGKHSMTPWGEQLNADDDAPVSSEGALLPPRLNQGRDSDTVQRTFWICSI